MRRWLPLLAFLFLGPTVYAQDERAGDDVGIDNVQLVVDPGSHTSWVRTLVFSSDGARLFTLGFDRTVQVWNTATGRRERALRPPLDLVVPATGPNVAMGMALSPDDRTLAVYGGNRRGRRAENLLLLVDLPSGNFKTLPAAPNTARLAWTPDGKRLAGTYPAAPISPNTTVHVWDVAGGAAPRSLTPGEERVGPLAFSRDGLLAVGSDDKTVRVCDLDRDAVQATLTHAEPVAAVAWGPAGKRLAAATGGDVHYWSVENKRLLHSFTPADLGPTCKDAASVAVVALQFLSRERLFVGWRAAGKDRKHRGGSSILNVRLGSGAEGYTRPLAQSSLFNAAASADGKWAALVDGRTIVLWPPDDPAKARVLGDAPPFPSNVGWGDDSKTLAWGGDAEERIDRNNLPALTHSLSLSDQALRSSKDAVPDVRGPVNRVNGWELRRGGGGLTVWRNGTQVYEHSSGTDAATLVPHGDGVLLAAKGPRTTGVHLIDPETGKQVRYMPSMWGNSYQVAASPDGKYLLTATRRQRLVVHAVETGEHLLSLFVAGEEWVAWTPQGYYAASPGGERMMGFAVQEQPDRLPVFHPAARFRDQLHRPEVVRLVLEKGSVQAALDAAAKLATTPRKKAELGKLLPPSVRLEVTDRSKLPAQLTVRATAEASVAEQPVTALQLILDGRPAPIDANLRTIDPPAKGKPVTAEWTLKVPPGTHLLAALARGRDTAGLSDGIEVTGTAAPKSLGTLHILAVGVSTYTNHGKGAANESLNLRYAAKDAKEIAGVLRTSCGGLFAPTVPRVLTDAQATASAVLAELVGLAKQAPEPGDLVVVYFSGHGERDDDGNLWLLTSEADRNNLTGTCLSGEKLKEALANLPCRVLLILDACHSAAVGRPRPSLANDLTAMLADESCGAAVLVASRGREFALEGVRVPIDGKERVVENGLFTWALRQALEGKASADPYDGVVYTHDVYQHVYREVKQHSAGRQHPYLGTPFGSRPLPLVFKQPIRSGERK